MSRKSLVSQFVNVKVAVAAGYVLVAGSVNVNTCVFPPFNIASIVSGFFLNVNAVVVTECDNPLMFGIRPDNVGVLASPL